VGIEDSFFALGGHSLLATRLASRIRKELSVEVPIRVVFEHPTVAGLAGWIGSQGDGSAVVRPRLQREPRPALVPLSAAQQRMWFLRQLEGTQATYHIPLSRRVRGLLDLDALRLALGDVLERHESLRTVFPVVEGEPWQEVLPVDPLSIPLAVEQVTEANVAERLLTAATCPFDLACELPIRVRVFVIGREEHVVLILLHHIAADGTSLRPLWRDLSMAYAARVSGEIPGWDPLPVQYADYTLWQQRWLGSVGETGSVASREVAYWRQALAGLPEELALPTDRPRPRVASYRGGTVPMSVSRELHDRLQRLSRAEGASLFMVLQGALAVLLSRLGAGTDIPLGSPIAGRLDESLQDQIGFYVNTLVLRTDVSGNPTFREVLRRVREFDLSAFAHQELPFEQLVQALQPQRSLARHPLFQVMLVLQNTGTRQESLQGLSVQPEPMAQTTSKFDLLWNCEELPAGGLQGTLEYNSDLFDRDTAGRFVEWYQRVLELVVESPEWPLSEYELLSAAERAQIVAWSHGPQRSLPAAGIHELFSRQVKRNPDAPAIESDEEIWSYRQLDEMSDRIAGQLTQAGLPIDSVVGVCMDRTPGQVAVLLGILKAGGAYMALDAKVPLARIRQMIESARPGWIVAEGQSHLDRARPTGIPVLEPDWGAEPGPAVRAAVAVHGLAYVSFTSGSTGLPKGVAVEHRGVVRLVYETDYVELSPDSRVGHFAPLAFDASTFEIWGPLLNGGVCVLIPEESLDLDSLERCLRRHRIETMWLTAALFNTIVDEKPSVLEGLRQILTGGEALSVPHVRRARERLGPHVRLINGYGPTECTTFATCHPISDADLQRGTAIPIGRPLVATQTLVLDPNGCLTPAGVVGELYLGGAGLARGYIGQPEMTAERFVPDPTGILPGQRLYRTGDLVRWTSDGTLDFIGRADQQVKIRGFRIELGEIESVLLRLPGVLQAAVIPSEGPGRNLELCGYVSVAPEITWTPSSLRRALGEELPQSMIPAEIAVLDEMPRTANGKLDRARLPAPDFRSGAVTVQEPQTALERTLARIWCEVLQVATVNCDTSFFDLGGHSLLAVRLFRSIERELGQKLPLESLFQYPTIAALADWIGKSAMAPQGPTCIVPLKPAGDRPPLFLLPSASGNLLFWQPLVEAAPTGLPVIGLSPVRNEAGDPVYTTLEATVAPLAEAVMNHQPEGPIHLAGYSAGAYMAQELARQLEQQGRTIGFLGLIDTGPARVDLDWTERVAMLPGFFTNLGYWTWENDHRISLRNLGRRLRTLWKRSVSRSSEKPVLGHYRRLGKELIDMVMRHETKPVSAPVTLIRARCQTPWHYRPECLGWSHYTADVRVRICPGVDHFNIISPRSFPEVNNHIVAALADGWSTVEPVRRSPLTHASEITGVQSDGQPV